MNSQKCFAILLLININANETYEIANNRCETQRLVDVRCNN